MRARLGRFDSVWALLAPIVALALRDHSLLEPGEFPATIPQTYQFVLVAACCTIASLLFFRLGDGMNRFFSLHDALSVCAASATAVASSSVLVFTVTRLEGVPRSTPIIHGLVLAGGLLLWRASRSLSPKQPSKHAPFPAAELRRVILIGVDPFAAAAIRLVDCQQPRTTQIVAALDGRISHVGRQIHGAKIIGLVHDIDAVIEEYAVHGVEIDEVWLSDDASIPQPAARRIAEQCRDRDIPLRRLSEALNLTPKAERAVTEDEGRLDATAEPSDYFRAKRALDVAFALSLGLALLPVAVCVACLALLDVGAPVVFWQQRIGQNGRTFLLYKFRTYRAPFDRRGRRTPEERRLSSFGRALRRTHLDELPQLYNVLIGDMSIVGPRPLLPIDQPSDPRTRLLAPPGLTGWAQINGGTLISAEEKDAMDAWYIRHASFALDLEILLRTAILAARGERVNAEAIEESRRWRHARLAFRSVDEAPSDLGVETGRIDPLA